MRAAASRRVALVVAVVVCATAPLRAEPRGRGAAKRGERDGDAGSPAARAEALNADGKRRIQLADLEEAAARFREAIALDPDPRYYFNLCYTLDRLGKLRSARAACEQVAARRADPRLADKARARLAEIDRRLAQAGDGDGDGGGDGDARGSGSARPVLPGPTDTLADGEPVAGAPAGRSPAPAAGPAIAVPPPLERPLPSLTPGARVGVGGSSLTNGEAGEGGDRTGARPAYAIGGSLVLWFGALGLQADAMIARRGATLDLSGSILGDVDGRIDLTYLDLDLLARLQPSRRGRLRPYALLGPALSISLAADGTVGENTVELEGVERFDVAAMIGAGVGIGGPRPSFALELRYLHGLRDVYADDSGDFGPASARNRTFLVIGAYEL